MTTISCFASLVKMATQWAIFLIFMISVFAIAPPFGLAVVAMVTSSSLSSMKAKDTDFWWNTNLPQVLLMLFILTIICGAAIGLGVVITRFIGLNKVWSLYGGLAIFILLFSIKKTRDTLALAYESFDRGVLALTLLGSALFEGRAVSKILIFLIPMGGFAIFVWLLYGSVNGWLSEQQPYALVAHVKVSMIFVVTVGLSFSLVRAFIRSGPWERFGVDIRLDLSEIKKSATTDLRIAQLSDIHLPEEEHGVLTEGKICNEYILPQLIENHLVSQEFSAVIFSGDVTDTGSQIAWRRFVRYVSPIADKLILAPGNHDLNIVGFGALSVFFISDSAWFEGRWKRICAYFDTATLVMGGRVFCVSSSGSLEQLEPRWQEIKLFVSNSQNFKEGVSRALGIFPLAVQVVSLNKLPIWFVVWNSVRISSSALWNSLGDISSEQLNNFYNLRQNLEGQLVAHVMHHKLAFPLSQLKGHAIDWSSPCKVIRGMLDALLRRLQLGGMVIRNPRAVCDAILAKDSESVVFHGHHHMRFFGRLKGNASGQILHVFSCPSTTLGCETNDQLAAGFDAIDLSVSNGSFAPVSSPRWVTA